MNQRMIFYRGRLLGALLSLFLGMLPAAAQLGDETAIPSLLDFYQLHSDSGLPGLSSTETRDLLAGKPIVKVSGLKAHEEDDELVSVGVYGLKIVEAPRLLIWLAVMGGNDERDERLTTAMLSRSADGSYVRYQHIDLPWPVNDRHWVIHCEKNPQIALKSHGVIWEHRWNLAERGPAQLAEALHAERVQGLTASDLETAVYLPENQGAWTMIELDPRRTLVIAYLNADLGGRFPGPVVRRFTRSNLKAGLSSLQELGSRVHLNYSAERPIHNGFGELIGKQEALDAAAEWQQELRLAARK